MDFYEKNASTKILISRCEGTKKFLKICSFYNEYSDICEIKSTGKKQEVTFLSKLAILRKLLLKSQIVWGGGPFIIMCAPNWHVLSKKQKSALSVYTKIQNYLHKMADINLSKIWNISTKNLSYESNQTVLQNRVQPSKISSKFCTSNLTFENHVPSNRYPGKLTWMICYLNGRVNLVFKKKTVS